MAARDDTLDMSFLANHIEHETDVTVYLLSGVGLHGRIKKYNEVAILLNDQLVFLHAVSTIQKYKRPK